MTTWPLPGFVSAYYRGDVEFRFTKPDASAVIETDIPGSQEFSRDRLTPYWRLSAPLDPSTTEFGDGEEGFICRTASALGVVCECCSDGEDFCLPLVADSITAPLVDMSVVAIDGTDCEGCLDGPPPDASAECPIDPDAP